MKMTCEKCGIEYEGHHRSKRCDACKGTAESLGSDVVVEADVNHIGSIPPGGSFPQDVKIISSPDPLPMTITGCLPDGFGIEIGIPYWYAFGMCEDGYEVFPGWVWSQKKLVCAKGDAPKEVLEWLQDAIQRPVVNRRPILGDDDYPGGK